MSTTEIYEQILDELAQGELEAIEQDVFRSLRRVYPQARTRTELILDVYGYQPAPEQNLNNNRHDRKIRLAISRMFDKGIPIVSTAGEAGYRIDVNVEEWAEMLAELERKRDSLSKRVEAARKIKRNIEAIGREAIPTDIPATPKQLSFI